MRGELVEGGVDEFADECAVDPLDGRSGRDIGDGAGGEGKGGGEDGAGEGKGSAGDGAGGAVEESRDTGKSERL